MRHRHLQGLGRRLAQGLAFALLASAAWASPAPMLGTWRGTVGQAPVMACFARFDDGQYYYLRHRTGIPLSRPDDIGSLSSEQVQALPVRGFRLEEQALGAKGDVEVSGRWRFERLDGQVLVGTWTSASGDRSLPIRLNKVGATVTEDAACGPEFMAPLLSGLHFDRKPARMGDLAYVALSSKDATSFEVGPDVPHAEQLNRFALDWLHSQAVFRYECDLGRAARGFGGRGDRLDRTLTPEYWSDRYLVLSDNLPEVFCGGSHGTSSHSYVVWSLAEGREVDGWVWIEGGRAVIQPRKTKGGSHVAGPLARLIASRHPSRGLEACDGSTDFMSIEAPHPDGDGLVFNTRFAHAIRLCDAEVKLSWKLLLPYLSREGRELMGDSR